MKQISLFILIISFICKGQSQKLHDPITTATPFLLITSDARAGGMGNVGVTTSSDAFSLYHNPSKIAFIKNKTTIGISYTPWLRNLTSDIFVGDFSYINKFKQNVAWGIELKYFSLGKIDFRTNTGLPNGYRSPSELAISGIYALKLNEKFSMGIALKYIYSNLDVSNVLTVVNSFAVDISGYYNSEKNNFGKFDGRYRFGFNIANIGPKVSYTPGIKNFIPTNLKIGGGFDFIFDHHNTLGVNLQITKLLVPTNSNSTRSWIDGIFTSFIDAPGGFTEEMKEFIYAFGFEYLYNNAFALRTGYFHESKSKGNKRFFTVGSGFKLRVFSLDLSYLINTSNVTNPLENTLRFSLSFDFGEIYQN